jgi:hypothetical protein
MNFHGIVIGIASFLIIGLFHPVVVKTEYHFGAKVWPVFLVAGLAGVMVSLFVGNTIVSAVIGVFGFSALWSIRELFEQVQRVRKGWFPNNPDSPKTTTPENI